MHFHVAFWLEEKVDFCNELNLFGCLGGGYVKINFFAQWGLYENWWAGFETIGFKSSHKTMGRNLYEKLGLKIPRLWATTLLH